jgi:hypothetical protein
MDTHTSSTLSIHEAAEQGDLERVKFLIDQGISVDARDSFRNTPLHHAVLNEHVSIVELLLEHGANPCAENNREATPLYFIALKPGITDQHNQIVKLLLQHGITANQLTSNTSTSFLHEAAKLGHSEIVRLFLMHGADPNAINQKGNTAWHVQGYTHYNPETIAIFLKHPDTNLGIRDIHNNTVIYRLVYNIKGAELAKKRYENSEDSAHQEVYQQAVHDKSRFIKCFQYFIFSGITLHEDEIRQACDTDNDPEYPVDFYPQIKDLIDEALRIKKEAEEELSNFSSIIAKHSKYFLLPPEDERKAFLETVNILYAHHAKNSQTPSFFKLPREIFDQIVDRLLGDYNFPRVDTHVTSASSYEDPISSHTITP